MADNTCFHTVAIEGMTFRGVLSADGPYISATSQRGLSVGGVALGIVHIGRGSKDAVRNDSEPGWWILKYSDEARIDLSGLSDQGRGKLSHEFGIPLGEFGRAFENKLFYRSTAFAGLCTWAKAHPRLFKRYSARRPYLPDWPERVAVAIGAKPVPQPLPGPAPAPTSKLPELRQPRVHGASEGQYQSARNREFQQMLDKHQGRPDTLEPNRVHNLFIGAHKHLYCLMDGTVRYQKAPLDARTCGKKRLLTRYLLLDVDTGVFYAEYHLADEPKDLICFLARAWAVKDKHAMRGLPRILNVPALVEKDAEYRSDLSRIQGWTDIAIGELPSGFSAGVHAIKQFDTTSLQVLWSRERALGVAVSIEDLQMLSGLLSAQASLRPLFRWKAKWAAVAPPPQDLYERINGLYDYAEDGDNWNTGPFEAVIDGFK